jgi:hypothetical protein
MSKAGLLITAVTIEKRPVAEVAATYVVSRHGRFTLDALHGAMLRKALLGLGASSPGRDRRTAR